MVPHLILRKGMLSEALANNIRNEEKLNASPLRSEPRQDVPAPFTQHCPVVLVSEVNQLNAAR
jgi:hypothetical protein